MTVNIDLMEIANRVMEEAAEQVLRRMVGDAGTWALDDKLREAIRDRVREMLREPDMESLLRDSVRSYIQYPEKHRR